MDWVEEGCPRRDEHLLTNALGMASVKACYKLSPPLAEFIRRHKRLMAAARWALTPVVFSIKHPTIPLGFAVTTMGLVVVVGRRNRDKRQWFLSVTARIGVCACWSLD